MCDGIRVVAAILSKGERVFVCKRPLEKRMGGMWEFPGGKLEADETPEAALIRECNEELSITICPGKLFHHWRGIVDGVPIAVSFYEAYITDGNIILSEHSEGIYVSPQQLSSYHLCPADAEVAQRLNVHAVRCASAQETTARMNPSSDFQPGGANR